MITGSFTPTTSGSRGDPNIPTGAKEVAVGSYHAWLVPVGYWGPAYVPPHSAKPRVQGRVIEVSTPGGQIQDLVIGSSGLQQAALILLVPNNLSSLGKLTKPGSSGVSTAEIVRSHSLGTLSHGPLCRCPTLARG
jgi:hypothetical protein